MTAAPNANQYVVGPVYRALKVLSFVGEQGHDISLTEVATALDIPKTTAFRYLQTLAASDFLDYDLDHDRYRVGMRFRNLARTDRSMQRLRESALPFMKGLSARFNETINLAILSDHRIVYIDIVESRRTLRMEARIGSRHPLHSTALGKAFLAFMAPQAREAELAGALQERTYRTITEADRLRLELETVRRDGHALDIGENEEDAVCIGVPILCDRDEPLAALSLSAPERRFTGDLRQEAIEALKEAARGISHALLVPVADYHGPLSD
ncbi:IclR family transcriptional regulator [Kaustia mangrovi]|uniref:IclR family transcriptional regulator n=1 Tax=Kaustia mangrovi TaxID=2593653 RepID=A0A7S8C438_9HYPH|nr:IclR family transcriptional regulator [Kaustia mangrovi]QPC42934.1 IclR family transcriptional regulator [Kaustia mangrovi]